MKKRAIIKKGIGITEKGSGVTKKNRDDKEYGRYELKI